MSKRKKYTIEDALRDLDQQALDGEIYYESYLKDPKNCPDVHKMLFNDLIGEMDSNIIYDTVGFLDNDERVAEAIREAFANIIELYDEPLDEETLEILKETDPEIYKEICEERSRNSSEDKISKEEEQCKVEPIDESIQKENTQRRCNPSSFNRAVYYYNFNTPEEYEEYEEELQQFANLESSFITHITSIEDPHVIKDALQHLYKERGSCVLFDINCGLVNPTKNKNYPITIILRNIKPPKGQNIVEFVKGTPQQDAYFDFMVIGCKSTLLPVDKIQLEAELNKIFKRSVKSDFGLNDLPN